MPEQMREAKAIDSRKAFPGHPSSRRHQQLVNAFRRKIEHCSGSLEAVCGFLAQVDAGKVVACMDSERADELVSECIDRAEQLLGFAERLMAERKPSALPNIEGQAPNRPAGQTLNGPDFRSEEWKRGRRLARIAARHHATVERMKYAKHRHVDPQRPKPSRSSIGAFEIQEAFIFRDRRQQKRIEEFGGERVH